MKVRWHISYDYRPELHNPFRAHLTIYLPTEKPNSSYLHPMLCCVSERVLGFTLRNDWGSVKNGELAETITVRGNSWDEVKQLVHEELEQAIATLNEVYRKNLTALATKPPDEHGEVDLRPD